MLDGRCQVTCMSRLGLVAAKHRWPLLCNRCQHSHFLALAQQANKSMHAGHLDVPADAPGDLLPQQQSILIHNKNGSSSAAKSVTSITLAGLPTTPTSISEVGDTSGAGCVAPWVEGAVAAADGAACELLLPAPSNAKAGVEAAAPVLAAAGTEEAGAEAAVVEGPNRAPAELAAGVPVLDAPNSAVPELADVDGPNSAAAEAAVLAGDDVPNVAAEELRPGVPKFRVRAGPEVAGAEMLAAEDAPNNALPGMTAGAAPKRGLLLDDGVAAAEL